MSLGTSDLYFMCLLKPLYTDIKVDTCEIASYKWMDVSKRTPNVYIFSSVFLLFLQEVVRDVVVWSNVENQ